MSNAAVPPHRGPDVLIIDDDEDIRLLARLTIEQMGYTVSEADGAESALAGLRSSPHPRVILLDLRLGDVDGYQVRTMLDADPDLRHIPVALFSAQVVVEGDIPDEVPEFVEVVRKPAMHADLERVLPDILGPAAATG